MTHIYPVIMRNYSSICAEFVFLQITQEMQEVINTRCENDTSGMVLKVWRRKVVQ